MLGVESYKKKYKIWFYAFLLSNLLMAGVVIVINPYRLFPVTVKIKGINDIKPKLYPFQQYIKLFDIAHQKPKTILLGSSRILWGVDPQSPILQQKNYTPVYNAGILGPSMILIRQYFDHALFSQPDLKRVILGIEYVGFNKEYDNKPNLHESYAKSEKELLAIHYKMAFDLKASFLTVASSIRQKHDKTLREDGRLTPAPLEEPDLYQDFFQPVKEKKSVVDVVSNKPTELTQTSKPSAIHLNEKQTLLTEKKPKPPQMRDVLYGNFQLSQLEMDAFHYIVQTCKERNIELYVFFTPAYNLSEIQAFHRLGLWENYKFFLKQLVSIYPFWSFVSWNKITSDKNNYVDGSHFVFSVGDMILKKMFAVKDDAIPENFGRYITQKNVHHFMQNLELEYQASIKNA